mgnify:CR=1 FL=1
MEYKKSQSLSEQAADEILDMIVVKKQFKIGDKLPNETELSALLNVSRTTLREAIKMLVLQDIVEIKRGKGTFVKSDEVDNFTLGNLKPNTSDLADLLEMRLIIEPMGAYYATKRASDNEIEKIILCGTPTHNPFTTFAITMAYFFKIIGMGKKPNKILNYLTFNSYNKGHKSENEWLSKNPTNISIYNDDELCGFTFTTNGFINLYKLLRRAFNIKLYKVQNKELEIFLIAGENDPVIQSSQKFKQLEIFLNKLGYENTKSKLYPDLRHEILNEEEYEQIYIDILKFIKGE